MSSLCPRVKAGFDGQGFMGHLGAVLEQAGDGRCAISVPFSEAVTQQHGFFHGGVTATLADNAGGFAAYSLMSENEQPLSVEFKISLLEKAEGEALVSRAEVIKNGRRLKVVHVDVFARREGQEKRIATALVTVIATHVALKG